MHSLPPPLYSRNPLSLPLRTYHATNFRGKSMPPVVSPTSKVETVNLSFRLSNGKHSLSKSDDWHAKKESCEKRLLLHRTVNIPSYKPCVSTDSNARKLQNTHSRVAPEKSPTMRHISLRAPVLQLTSEPVGHVGLQKIEDEAKHETLCCTDEQRIDNNCGLSIFKSYENNSKLCKIPVSKTETFFKAIESKTIGDISPETQLNNASASQPFPQPAFPRRRMINQPQNQKLAGTQSTDPKRHSRKNRNSLAAATRSYESLMNRVRDSLSIRSVEKPCTIHCVNGESMLMPQLSTPKSRVQMLPHPHDKRLLSSFSQPQFKTQNTRVQCNAQPTNISRDNRSPRTGRILFAKKNGLDLRIPDLKIPNRVDSTQRLNSSPVNKVKLNATRNNASEQSFSYLLNATSDASSPAKSMSQGYISSNEENADHIACLLTATSRGDRIVWYEDKNGSPTLTPRTKDVDKLTNLNSPSRDSNYSDSQEFPLVFSHKTEIKRHTATQLPGRDAEIVKHCIPQSSFKFKQDTKKYIEDKITMIMKRLTVPNHLYESVVGVKGGISENQDATFLLRVPEHNINDIFCYGLCDGHGSEGHIISQFVCNLLESVMNIVTTQFLTLLNNYRTSSANVSIDTETTGTCVTPVISQSCIQNNDVCVTENDRKKKFFSEAETIVQHVYGRNKIPRGILPVNSWTDKQITQKRIFKQTFIDLFSRIESSIEQQHGFLFNAEWSGCTVVLILRLGPEVWIAWTGDSKCVVYEFSWLLEWDNLVPEAASTDMHHTSHLNGYPSISLSSDSSDQLLESLPYFNHFPGKIQHPIAPVEIQPMTGIFNLDFHRTAETKDHCPSRYDEGQRILTTGGKIIKSSSHLERPTYRIMPTGIAMSRSLGDVSAEQFGLIHTPDVFCVQVPWSLFLIDSNVSMLPNELSAAPTNKKYWCFVLGSDGIWDTASSTEVAKDLVAGIILDVLEHYITKKDIFQFQLLANCSKSEQRANNAFLTSSDNSLTIKDLTSHLDDEIVSIIQHRLTSMCDIAQQRRQLLEHYSDDTTVLLCFI